MFEGELPGQNGQSLRHQRRDGVEFLLGQIELMDHRHVLGGQSRDLVLQYVTRLVQIVDLHRQVVAPVGEQQLLLADQADVLRVGLVRDDLVGERDVGGIADFRIEASLSPEQRHSLG